LRCNSHAFMAAKISPISNVSDIRVSNTPREAEGQ
jgi:hypothetical protein